MAKTSRKSRRNKQMKKRHSRHRGGGILQMLGLSNASGPASGPAPPPNAVTPVAAPVTVPSGGGSGQGGYAFTGAAIMPGLGNAAVNQPQASCLAVAPPGQLTLNPTGLPGNYSQAGGRYGFDLTAQAAPAAGGLGGIPQVVSIPCEGSYSNPLNQSTGVPVNPNLPQLGGANPADTAALYVPTAGYSLTPSTWTGTNGAPALLSIPYDARSMTPACLTTGGGRKGRSTRSRRKQRKHSKRR